MAALIDASPPQDEPDAASRLAHSSGGEAPMSLERELETFRRELPLLLIEPANHGKHALIYNDKVVGVWDTVDEALAAGYDAFQLDSFLVKEIVEHERPRHFSRNVSRCP